MNEFAKGFPSNDYRLKGRSPCPGSGTAIVRVSHEDIIVGNPALHRAEAVARYSDQPSKRSAVFLIQTLKKPWSIADTPYPKKRHRLPAILSQEEVAQLIDAAPTALYRTVLMTLYATGVRNAELTRLKISDVDSQRMVLHVQG
jgi:integrase